MGYAFKSRLLKGFSRMPSEADQLAAVHDSFWNKDTLQIFTDNKDFLEPAFEDLNGLLSVAETGRYDSGIFGALASTCTAMSVKADPSFMKSLYQMNNQIVGTFLMRCMRVNNLKNHSTATLKEFKKLFDAMGIRVSGPWDSCVEMASFGSTSFADGTLVVEHP